MMRNSVYRVGSCVALACVAVLSATNVFGELIHYQPFDDAGAASLVNKGSAGGTSTVVATYGQTPSDSTDAPTGLPGHSESFPTNSFNFGGRVDIANSASTLGLDTATQSMTISLWVKWDGAPSTDVQGLVAKLSGGQDSGWALAVRNDGKLRFSWTEQNPSNPYGGNRFSNTALTAGAWTQVAMTWKGGDSEGLKFYVNGEDAGISQAYTGAPLMNANTQAIRIGNIDGSYLPFRGTADEVGIWNSVLSAGEIRAIDQAPATLAGYSADKMQTLFSLYEAASPTGSATIGTLNWTYATGLTGHSAGDVWQVGDQYFMQLDANGAGVTAAVPEPAALAAFGAAAMFLRRRRAQ